MRDLQFKKEPLKVELYFLYYVILRYMELRTYEINQLNISANPRGIVTKKSDIVQRGIRYADDMVFF